MTTIPPITGTAAVDANSAASTPAPKQTLDADVFMKLLVTQLSNQDPSSPMDTNEMIAQTTQLASMEQLTALAATTTESFALSMRQTAAALIGQEAQYVDADGVEQSGIVSSVSFAGPIPIVTIGDTPVALDAVSGLTLKS
ncbi:flagellar hook assembly protein FlgD [Microbacterium sp. CIAB417]|uniref:flagellar hook assembly protein FlgD n=1 Tax=Microbacterium sp. CIAB417 TaxID=2860287 RepID=UPI001FAD04BE|nr:flagellar hook capping FlgD N-terminal domain-containing protein [Microbacterium sp. CIAB417]